VSTPTDKQGTLTAHRLRQLLDYDSATGLFRWRANPRVGRVAGYVKQDGARRIKINGRTYMASRLAWLWMTGRWPVTEINHRNGVKDDDRIVNLREASHSQIQIAWKELRGEFAA
jgi:hypothetical protein